MLWKNIPEDLKINGLWCNWKLIKKNNRLVKLPYNSKTGKLAKSNDKNTFHNYEVALDKMPEYYGITAEKKISGGLGLGIFNDFSAIDIDNCVKNNVISDFAMGIIKYCDSYTELSPSKNGIRIIFKTNTKLDNDKYYINNRKIGLEIYLSEQTNKYVTITGRVVEKKSINTIDLSLLLNKYMLKNTSADTPPVITSGTSEHFAIEDFKKDDKLMKLWNAAASGAGGDESENDMALCSKLAYYLKGDYNAINKAFMSSPYYLSKDESHIKKWEVRKDYQKTTINNAIKLVSFAVEKATSSDDYDLTDTGNARQFAKKFKDTIKYNVDNQSWMIWNGEYWQTDLLNDIKNYAEILIEQMKVKARKIDNENIQQAMFKNIKRALMSSGKQALLKEAEHLNGIPVTNSYFNNDDFKFNCKSGIVDLKTGVITPHDRLALHSKYSSLEIDKSPPKLWLKFLNEILENDQEIINYVQRVAGYSLTGSSREQSLFMFIGDGSNGKSLLLEILNEISGSYSSHANVEMLLEQPNNNTENLGAVARLNGIRQIVTSEVKLNQRLNESAVKVLTSGLGLIVARYLYKNEFEFRFKAKILMDANYKPIIKGTDHGIWRRIKVIPFNLFIPDDKQDKGLADKLRKEMPKILWWLIQGAIKWNKVGLKEPEKLKELSKAYKSEMDVVQKWLDEACLIHSNYREKSSVLFSNFNGYITKNKEYQISHTTFGRNLAKKFQKIKRGGAYIYLGIRLKPNNMYNTDNDV